MSMHAFHPTSLCASNPPGSARPENGARVQMAHDLAGERAAGLPKVRELGTVAEEPGLDW